MNKDALHRLSQADGFLRELGLVNPLVTPRVTAHAAYYAMFHAASAIVAAAGIRTVKTHSGLNTLLARVLREHSPDDLDLVRDLTRAFEIRILVDYDDGGIDPTSDAAQVAQGVPAYVARCRQIAKKI